MTVTDAAEAQVTAADMATFTRQLGAMLDAGVDVLRALRIASEHSGNRTLIAASRDIRVRLEDGREFHDAIVSHPELFDAFYVEMARQGEKDGLLGRALLSVADYLDRLAQNGVSPTPGAATVLPLPPTLVVLTILGMLALGTAVLWGIATAQPNVLPIIWLPSAIASWAALCLLGGARVLYQQRGGPVAVPTARVTAVEPPAPLPPKTVERKDAETEGIVRSALQEQQEEADATLRISRVKPNADRGLPYTNGKPKTESGKAQDTDLFEPGGDTPRFDL
jgi:hypothetical protein